MNFFCVLIFKDACTHNKIFFSLSFCFIIITITVRIWVHEKTLSEKKNIEPDRRGSEKLINLSEEKDKKERRERDNSDD